MKNTLPNLLDNTIKPTLLHGDLWSGNDLSGGNHPYFIDTASYYGHREIDFSLTFMFGGFDDDFYKKTICDYLKKFDSAKRAELEQLLLDKLPDILDEQQKSNKVKNLLQSLRKADIIRIEGKLWRISKV